MDNKFFICENIFGYLGSGGGGGGGFNNQTGPILVHIYPLIYINLHTHITACKVVSETFDIFSFW